jgi:tRNA-2-methylthio-N6-dimethylallyladenosine synthase
MNRGYTRERYLDLAAAIRERIPGASITTDIIVGFPGETQEDFEDTLDLVKRVGFDSAFTFMFSPRSGTPAATMEGQVPLETRKSRLSRLIEMQKAITLERNLALVGKKVEVLVEGPSKKEPERLQGRTRTGRYVHFLGPPSWKGSLVGVVITRAGLWSLDGERSEKQP